MKKDDFKIVEYDGVFTIKRRQMQRCWWWQSYSEYWVDVDDNGEYLMLDTDFNKLNHPGKTYDNIHDALNKIETILKGEIIHEIQ